MYSVSNYSASRARDCSGANLQLVPDRPLAYHRPMSEDRLKVHLLHPLDEPYAAQLRRALDRNIRLTEGSEVPADCRVLIAGVPDRDRLEALPDLEALIIPWAGLPVKTRKLAQDFANLKVFNIHHNASAAAEHAVGLLLAAAKSLIPIDRALHQNDWRPRYADPEALLLEGRMAIVLGYGAIGRRIARALEAIGMAVHAVKRTAGETLDGEIHLHPKEDLPDLLSEAVALMVALPLTEETRGLIGSRELSLLPGRSVVVNVARGAIIDERALYEELNSGRLRAGLDVWYEYPADKESRADTPPSQYDFGSLPNVVMTPHLAGHTVDTEKLRLQELARLLNSLARGDQLTPIDIPRGY